VKEPALQLTPHETEAAILAPVPYEHLVSGLNTCAAEGKVAFGSRAYEVFRAFDQLVGKFPAPVLIYASDDQAKFPLKATWSATYAGSVETANGRHPAGMKYRPASTAQYPGDNVGHWAVFWEVSDLSHLGHADGVLISSLYGFRSKKRYTPGFRPEGPLIVENPYIT
jgi:hypothetical protein